MSQPARVTASSDLPRSAHLGGRVIGWPAIAAVIAALVAGSIGYWIGTNHSPMTMHSCRAYAAPSQVSATCADGWVYDVPVEHVEWTDASGIWHSQGRPDCIPAGPQEVGLINFGSVDVKVSGSEWRSVVYVSC